jgi:uracil-DNA glycosylase
VVGIRVFKSYMFSSEFSDVLTKLYTLSSENKRFTPPLKDLFTAFEECPYNNYRVVIVGQDPYPTLGVADGISFSCSKTGKLQPSLRYIFDEVNRTIYDGNQLCDRC